MRNESGRAVVTGGRGISGLALTCVLVLSHAVAGHAATPKTLEQLTEERQMLTAQLDQYRKSLEILQPDGTPPEQSANPAVRSLAVDAAALKQQLIAVTEQEVTLLQQDVIAGNKSRSATTAPITTVNAALPAEVEPPPGNAIETKPLRTRSVDDTQERDAQDVEHLHQLLEGYYTELQESAQVLPTGEELARRETSRRDAETLDKIPFSVDKVRLNGSEASTALAEISKRLMDPRIPESRRDIAPICTIKTRLFDTLVSSENRSLKPVGKNHYIARVQLQPGTTTLSILSNQWEVQLPQQSAARDYLITLYHPVDGGPELHVFAVDDLLAAERPYIPAWLPAELDIKTKAG
jgi:hypothetical protein